MAPGGTHYKGRQMKNRVKNKFLINCPLSDYVTPYLYVNLINIDIVNLDMVILEHEYLVIYK